MMGITPIIIYMASLLVSVLVGCQSTTAAVSVSIFIY